MRFLLVDRITSMEVGASVEGYSSWAMSNDVFRDHFPGTPIVPGVLLVEAMAQLVGFLVERSYYDAFGDERNAGPILSIIHKAKFRSLVRPGDRVDMKGRLRSLDQRRASCAIKAYVGGRRRAEADLSFAILVRSHEEVDPELRAQRRAYERAVMGELFASADPDG